MSIYALLVAIAATLAFLYGLARPERAQKALGLGLALYVIAWVLQAVVLSGPHWHIGP